METLVTFLLFTGLVAVLTWVFTRKDDRSTNDGYFLAGRSLTFPFIAGSLLLTNLSTEQMVGLNGSAYRYGLSVMVWEVVAVIALVCMSWFFLPRFLKSGVATVPEYLDIRFDKQTQTITNIIFFLAYAFQLLPIILFTGARGLIGILNIPQLVESTGIEFLTQFTSEDDMLWIIVFAVGIIGSIYALWGGLSSVAFSDTINGVGLLIGGFMITYFGLNAISGGEGMLAGIEHIQAVAPEKLNSIGGPTTEVPFDTIISGVLIINMFYWCTNQQIIQRTFGASSLAEGQKGVLLTGALKLLGPMYLVIPGIIAYVLFINNPVEDSNQVYGLLVRQVLPASLSGFFAAAMLGAILSSFNSALNSTCTLFSLGIYKEFINPTATDKQVVASGRWFGIVIALVAMCVAPLLAGQKSIFDYLQKMNSIYFIPIFAVVLIGMLTNRVPPKAAKFGLIAGVLVIAIGYFVPPFDSIVAQMKDYHFVGFVFAYLVLAMLLIGSMYPMKEEFVQQDVKAVDMTPWKHTKKAGALLLILVVLIYASFADFSVLKSGAKDEKTPMEQKMNPQETQITTDTAVSVAK